MNSWVIIYLPGNVGTSTLVYGPFPSLEAAITGMVSTGAPWNYQPCQCYGPATPPPMTAIQPYPVVAGAWIGIAFGLSPGGNVVPYGYASFASKAEAEAWAGTQDSPAAYSFGQVEPL